MWNLIWKDCRHLRAVVALTGVALLMPYILMTVLALMGLTGPQASLRWTEPLLSGAGVSIIMLPLVGAFVVGHAGAGERTDRSAEFLAYLPVSRTQLVASRLLVAGATVVVPFVVNIAVAAVALHFRNPGHDYSPDSMIANSVCAATLVFGAAWAGAAVLQNAAVAASLGVGLILLVGGSAVCSSIALQASPRLEWIEPVFRATCLSLGLLMLGGGTGMALRRLNP